MWCVAHLDDEYIQRMENILDLYEQPLKPKEPVICLDEKPIQLLKDVRKVHRRLKPGKIRHRDYEYARRGTANVFAAVEPLAGKHFAKATENRKACEFANVLKEISLKYEDAEKIHLVVDNLNTHSITSLIKAFGPDEGMLLWKRFTLHYTPKHASWLNQAEIELSMYSRECLGKERFATMETIKRKTNLWLERINDEQRKIEWKFTTKRAREKFKYTLQN